MKNVLENEEPNMVLKQVRHDMNTCMNPET